MILVTVTVTPIEGGDRNGHQDRDGGAAARMRQKTGLHPCAEPLTGYNAITVAGQLPAGGYIPIWGMR
jgi:hypothetical protein